MFDLEKLIKLQQDLQLSFGSDTNMLDDIPLRLAFGCSNGCYGSCKGSCDDTCWTGTTRR